MPVKHYLESDSKRLIREKAQMSMFKASAKKLRSWWKTPLGKAFLVLEAVELRKLLSTLFGYHLLVLGETCFLAGVQSSPIRHRVLGTRTINASHPLASLVLRYDKLPFIADGVDLVYLAHCLEFINNPHEVLREVFRILIPEGHVIISHFNPWSVWGLWRWLTRWIKTSPWDGRFISVTRLKDWLALLGFDVVQTRYFFFRPPVAHATVLGRLAWLEKIGALCWPFLGGGYVVLAQKRVLTLTPIRPVFQTKRKLLVPGIIEVAPSE